MPTMKDSLETASKAIDVTEKGAGVIEKLLSLNPSFRANKMLLNEIEHDPNMTPTQKAVIMYNMKKLKKEMQNRFDICEIADSMLNSRGKSLVRLLPTIDDEWFGMYDDISKNVSDTDMQTVWAKILSSKCEDEHSVSKKLLQVLQVMDSNDAEYFSYLCAHSFMCTKNETDEGYPVFIYPNIIKDDLDIYDNKKVNYIVLSNLSSLGLINYTTSAETIIYQKSNYLFFRYYDEIFDVKSDNGRINMGIVVYTSCGAELVKILYDGMSDKKDPQLIAKVSEYYKRLHYTVNV